MSQETKEFKEAFKDKAYPSTTIGRISFNPNIIDPDLDFEDIINPFEMDQNKILSSKSLRRESNKTQVIFHPDNPHVRNRMTHTHEVMAISNTISQSLGLNSELTKSIAMGHDLGHGPCGHLFEEVSKSLGVKFQHERFSAIVATSIERKGDGLILTKETLNGILEHSRGAGELTVDKNSVNENLVVMYSDKIAYIFSDVNDFKRLGWISPEDYKKIDSLFPGTQRERVNQCIFSLIKESSDKGSISFNDSKTAKDFADVKSLMYGYYTKVDRIVLGETLKIIYDCVSHINQLQKYDPTLIIALMTDKELGVLIPKIVSSKRINLDDLKDFGVFEIIENGSLIGKTYVDLDQQLSQKMDSEKI